MTKRVLLLFISLLCFCSCQKDQKTVNELSSGLWQEFDSSISIDGVVQQGLNNPFEERLLEFEDCDLDVEGFCPVYLTSLSGTNIIAVDTMLYIKGYVSDSCMKRNEDFFRSA